MSSLSSITQENFNDTPLPIEELLANSAFYAAAGSDWNFIREVNAFDTALDIKSYIYCDYCIGRDEVLRTHDKVEGYKVVATKNLNLEDLVPAGIDMSDMPNYINEQYLGWSSIYRPFSEWTIYGRMEDVGEQMGPSRFSVLYIGAEGVKTYRALYWKYRKSAKLVALIQAGEGFGFNYTGFRQSLRWVIEENPADNIPDKVYYGGQLNEPDKYNLDWPQYKFERTITDYYWGEDDDYGSVNIYKRISI